MKQFLSSDSLYSIAGEERQIPMKWGQGIGLEGAQSVEGIKENLQKEVLCDLNFEKGSGFCEAIHCRHGGQPLLRHVNGVTCRAWGRERLHLAPSLYLWHILVMWPWLSHLTSQCPQATQGARDGWGGKHREILNLPSPHKKDSFKFWLLFSGDIEGGIEILKRRESFLKWKTRNSTVVVS